MLFICATSSHDFINCVASEKSEKKYLVRDNLARIACEKVSMLGLKVFWFCFETLTEPDCSWWQIILLREPQTQHIAMHPFSSMNVFHHSSWCWWRSNSYAIPIHHQGIVIARIPLFMLLNVFAGVAMLPHTSFWLGIIIQPPPEWAHLITSRMSSKGIKPLVRLHLPW